MRKENRNLRKIPTPQLVKYKYYKKILHIPQCWYHHQSHARFRQADNKSTAAYTVEEASKVFFTTTVQGSCWVLSTATFCPVQILLIWTVGQRSRFVDSERLLTANICWQQPLPKATLHPVPPPLPLDSVEKARVELSRVELPFRDSAVSAVQFLFGLRALNIGLCCMVD